jgi:NRAMP (natural resistance-associated macrophage protein)-like metal ion transporter
MLIPDKDTGPPLEAAALDIAAVADMGRVSKFGFLRMLGPGLITGAADDDPSGIATYSQVGAQFGFGMAWVMIVSYPLMVAIQEISARIGRVTGQGIAGNIRQHYSVWLLRLIVGLLLIANTINLGADLGGMGDALKLLIGGSTHLYVVLFAVGCALLEIFSSYDRYVAILKWSTLSLFAYVATVLVVHVSWADVGRAIVMPPISLGKDYIVAVVAVLGTTISPYLFFWQSSEEAEDERTTDGDEPLLVDPAQAPRQLRRIKIDTYFGMAVSNVIALFIIITTAATLNAHGVTDIQTSAQAAQALKPIAGPLAFVVFAAGIIGTGLLAIPVLAGSAAYAVGEALDWPTGLGRKPREAKAFYGVVAFATLIGIGINFTSIDPIKALFWSAVINGVVAVPVMILMMLMVMKPKVMGDFTLSRPLQAMGWLSTAVMAITVIGMLITMA